MVANSMIRSLHGARQRAGMDEETFRDWLERDYGSRHVSALDGPQLQSALTVLNGRAGPAAKSGRRGQLSGPYASKLHALWLSGFNLGVVRDRRDEAMLKFIERQTGIQRTEFLRNAADSKKAIEALKGWLARDGGVDWSIGRNRAEYLNNPRYKIVEAQVRKLVVLGRMGPFREAIDGVVEAVGVRGRDALVGVKAERWTDTQQQLGVMIRSAK